MSNLKITDTPFTKEHDTPDMILKKSDKTDSRQYTDVFVKCKEKARSRVQEYLKGMVIEYLPNGDTFMKFTVVENEQFWFGTLLSLGDCLLYTSFGMQQEKKKEAEQEGEAAQETGQQEERQQTEDGAVIEKQ